MMSLCMITAIEKDCKVPVVVKHTLFVRCTALHCTDPLLLDAKHEVVQKLIA